MAFTVNDFQDMLVILEHHPEWRRQLLVVLLPDDFIQLPASVEALTHAVEAMGQTVQAMAERQDRMEAAITSLTERLERYIVHSETQFDAIRSEFRVVRHDLGKLKGSDLESRYRQIAPALFGDRLSGGRLASNEVGQWVHAAVKAGQLSAWERKHVLAADLLWAGKLWDDERSVVLVVEASWTVMPEDIDRAFDRAALLQRLGRLAIPIAAGEVWSDEVAALAESKRVARITDGMIDEASWDAAFADAAERAAA